MEQNFSSYINEYGIRKSFNETQQVELNNFILNKGSINYTPFSSQWVVGISYKEVKGKDFYIVVVFFNPNTTKCPKWPMGFPPMCFTEVSKDSIEDFENASSKGQHYLDYWAYEKQKHLGTLSQFQAYINELKEKDRQWVESMKSPNQAEQENTNEADKEKADGIHTTEQFIKESEEINKTFDQGNIPYSNFVVESITNLEYIFGFQVDTKLKQTILKELGMGHLTKFNKSFFNKWKTNMRQVSNLLKYNGIKGTIKIQTYVVEDYIKNLVSMESFDAMSKRYLLQELQLNSFKSGWNSVKSMKKIMGQINKEGYFSGKFIKDNIDDLVKVKAFRDKETGKYYYKVLDEFGEIKNGDKFISKAQLKFMKERKYITNEGIFSKQGLSAQFKELQKQNKIMMWMKKPVVAVRPAIPRRIAKNVVRLGYIGMNFKTPSSKKRKGRSERAIRKFR